MATVLWASRFTSGRLYSLRSRSPLAVSAHSRDDPLAVLPCR